MHGIALPYARNASKSRTNLSEDQKRSNHIISEQKRRDIIKQAFMDLNKIVPALQGGTSGHSRKEVIREVALYIQSTVQGNSETEVLVDFGGGGSGGDNDLVGGGFEEAYE